MMECSTKRSPRVGEPQAGREPLERHRSGPGRLRPAARGRLVLLNHLHQAGTASRSLARPTMWAAAIRTTKWGRSTPHARLRRPCLCRCGPGRKRPKARTSGDVRLTDANQRLDGRLTQPGRAGPPPCREPPAAGRRGTWPAPPALALRVFRFRAPGIFDTRRSLAPDTVDGAPNSGFAIRETGQLCGTTRRSHDQPGCRPASSATSVGWKSGSVEVRKSSSPSAEGSAVALHDVPLDAVRIELGAEEDSSYSGPNFVPRYGSGRRCECANLVMAGIRSPVRLYLFTIGVTLG